VHYILTAIIEQTTFQKLIEAQQLPASWISGLIDSTGHFIARVPALAHDELASEDFRAAVAQTPEGWYRGASAEGADTYTAHETSDFTHWSVGFAMPAAAVNAAAKRAAWLVSIGGLVTIALAYLLAYVAGRRITAPVTELASAARSLGDGKVPGDISNRSDIREVHDLAHALMEASSALRQREDLIQREQSILIAANRAKDEFLAMLGHELRNPLSAVSNAALLLGRPGLSAEKRDAVHGIISRQTEQLTRLVNDLLDVGRAIAGKMRLEETRVDLGHITEAAVTVMKATGRPDSHRISVHCEPAVYVRGDRARLEQVVTNLLSNAIAYTPAGGSIDICVVKDAGSAVLRMADTGVGLTEEDRGAIFGLFYQVDKGLYRKGGLGLGLTLVNRLVEMHGGVLSAASPGLGKGSTFTVQIPLLNDRREVAVLTENEKSVTSQLKILVVDDGEDARTSLQILLGYEGHVVHVAGDAQSALRAVLADRPDLALLDIGMPDKDGYQLAREIRQRTQGSILLIALTGYGQPADVQHAIDAGFDGHLVKPLDLAALNALLANLLPRHHFVLTQGAG
jgi:signal transduction histidine kinase/ActR/RegA family two-component response regulator